MLRYVQITSSGYLFDHDATVLEYAKEISIFPYYSPDVAIHGMA